MCTIIITQVDAPFPGIRQILDRSVLHKGGDELIPSERWDDFSRIPEEERYSLMAFLMARTWSIACDILKEHPSLVAPWALNCLRGLALGEHLSATDCGVFWAHIFVLDLAQTLGIGQTRAFLTHRFLAADTHHLQVIGRSRLSFRFPVLPD